MTPASVFQDFGKFESDLPPASQWNAERVFNEFQQFMSVIEQHQRVEELLPQSEKYLRKLELMQTLGMELKKQFNDIRSELKALIKNNKLEYVEQNTDENEIDDLLYKDETAFLNDNMVRIFAIVKDAARRLCGTQYTVMGQSMEWDMVHYDVQLMGGIILHQGKIAQ